MHLYRQGPFFNVDDLTALFQRVEGSRFTLAWRLLRLVSMKIAIAHWQNRISPVFDVADRLILIDVEDGREVHRESLRLEGRDPFGRTRALSNLGVDVLLCGAVSRGLEKALVAAGIQVLGFLGGKVESIVSAFIDGQLNDGRSPRADRSGRQPHLEKRPGEEKGQKPPVHAFGIER
jgi:predicted Fe-Mo cluster-binding NifX family protein